MQQLNAQYWEQRHQKNDTPWHLNDVSQPLATYIDQIDNKNISVLIPGAGHYHEAKYLWEKGFRDITICDISPTAIANIQVKLEAFNGIQYITDDFFKLSGKYDLILEQTFFCALNPSYRQTYVEKMRDILTESGKLVGVLFASPFPFDGPPFGGDINEYKNLFKNILHINIMELCTNSNKPRMGNEVFFICYK